MMKMSCVKNLILKKNNPGEKETIANSGNNGCANKKNTYSHEPMIDMYDIIITNICPFFTCVTVDFLAGLFKIDSDEMYRLVMSMIGCGWFEQGHVWPVFLHDRVLGGDLCMHRHDVFMMTDRDYNDFRNNRLSYSRILSQVCQLADAWKEHSVVAEGTVDAMILDMLASEENDVSSVKKPVQSDGSENLLKEGKKYLDYLCEIRVGIDDKDLVGRIAHIEDMVFQMLELFKSHPEQQSSIRKVLHVYLPMVVKILMKYQDVNGKSVVGMNMLEIKKAVEDSTVMVNDAFEKLLDSMYQDMALDVITDIDVLSGLFKQDGLGESDFKMTDVCAK